MYVGLACALSWEVNLGKSLPVVQVLKDEGVVESSWGLATVWQNWSPWREAISEGTASVAVKAPGFGAMRERAMEKVEVWYRLAGLETRKRVQERLLVKMQPSYIGIPRILEKLGSWDYYQEQQQLWNRTRLSLGGKPCVLWMSDLGSSPLAPRGE